MNYGLALTREHLKCLFLKCIFTVDRFEPGWKQEVGTDSLHNQLIESGLVWNKSWFCSEIWGHFFLKKKKIAKKLEA